jgi:hypothetical protein
MLLDLHRRTPDIARLLRLRLSASRLLLRSHEVAHSTVLFTLLDLLLLVSDSAYSRGAHVGAYARWTLRCRRQSLPRIARGWHRNSSCVTPIRVSHDLSPLPHPNASPFVSPVAAFISLLYEYFAGLDDELRFIWRYAHCPLEDDHTECDPTEAESTGSRECI